MWEHAIIIVLLVLILGFSWNSWRMHAPQQVAVVAVSDGSAPAPADCNFMMAANNAASSVATFSNTLARRLGMDGAGAAAPSDAQHFSSNDTFGTFDSYKQNFRVQPDSPDTAYGTQWAGNMQRGILLG